MTPDQKVCQLINNLITCIFLAILFSVYIKRNFLCIFIVCSHYMLPLAKINRLIAIYIRRIYISRILIIFRKL